VTVDGNGLEVLDRTACLPLLASATVGRVGVWFASGPEVLPVNYALSGDDLVIGTNPAGRLHGALGTEPLAFEVDDVDPAYEWGWSVLVRGRARHLDDPAEVARAERLPLRSWGPGRHRAFVAVALTTADVSGRRLGLHGIDLR
jgi:nitroimidazol reductase NimA-like FMN-containing flavoprotein (pyridoxamine 5'-phosphate oxidase superfamily)